MKVHQQPASDLGPGLLAGKRAIVFGAAGSIGAAVAKEFAKEGAQVTLVGRSSTVDDVAAQIAEQGGQAERYLADAQDESAVEEVFRQVARDGRNIDVSFTAVGPRASEYGNGTQAIDLSLGHFMVPLTEVVRANFVTARAAARQMTRQRSGTILFLSGSPARGHVQGAAAIGAAFGALESLMESMAFELGPVGVRVLCLRTTANVDSRTMQDTFHTLAAQMHVSKDEMVASMASLNFLKSPASTADTARLAAFLASDRARLMTGTVVNSTAGAALD